MGHWGFSTRRPPSRDSRCIARATGWNLLAAEAVAQKMATSAGKVEPRSMLGDR